MSTFFSRLSITACFLLMTACNNSPTQMDNQTFQLDISGTFAPSANSVSVSQVALVFDGTVIAIEACNSPGLPECRSVEVTAAISAPKGQHAVRFQLLRHFCDLLPCNGKQPYNVSGNVMVSGSGRVVQQIPLAGQNVNLEERDMVTYPINVNP